MNTNNGEGNTQIPVVEELIIEDGDTIETIKEKTDKHNESVKAYKEFMDSQNGQLFARTKKAEGFEPDGKGGWIKTAKPVEKKPEAATTSKEDTLSQADLITIVRNNIPEEDVPDVVEYAKFKGITVAEALKAPVVIATLAEKKEARNVAEGTSTGAQRRSSSKLSDDALLANAEKDEMPESEEEIARLNNLRWGVK